MPRRDGTGPEGAGSRTGRGLGNCAPNKKANTDSDQTQNEAIGTGRGLGRGRGLGNGGRGLGRKQ